jgi:hypothetical protein
MEYSSTAKTTKKRDNLLSCSKEGETLSSRLAPERGSKGLALAK